MDDLNKLGIIVLIFTLVAIDVAFNEGAVLNWIAVHIGLH
jgi:hypothetical protein